MSSAAEPTPSLIRLSDTDRVIIESSDDIRGRTVVDVTASELGKVSDLLVDDRAEQVRFLVVSSGGLLGIGATESFLPVDIIVDIDDETVRVDTNREAVAGAPEYDPEIGLEQPFVEGVYGYYGFTPFWTPGYIPPSIPRPTDDRLD